MSSEYGSENQGGANQRPRYYEILCVPHGATGEQIKLAFRKRARETHPDHNPGIDRKEFQLVNEAYQVLSNEVERAKYNRSLQSNPFHQSEASGSSSRPYTAPDSDWGAHVREDMPRRPAPQQRKEDPEHKEQIERDYAEAKRNNEQEYRRKIQEATATSERCHEANQKQFDAKILHIKQVFSRKMDAAQVSLQQAKISGKNVFTAERVYSIQTSTAEREFSIGKSTAEREFIIEKNRIEREYLIATSSRDREYVLNKHRIDREYSRNSHIYSH